MGRMSASAGGSKGRKPPNPDLPKGFSTIKDILNSERPCGFVSLFGVVTDRRLPVQSKGTDYKSTITLVDLSTQEDGESIDLIIFRPEKKHPDVGAGDVLLLFQVKVQSWGGTSLITNHSTVINVYDAKKIPTYPRSARGALKSTEKGRVPKDEDHEYVSYIRQALESNQVPDQADFEVKVQASANVKQKFQLIKDVRDGMYVDLVGRVVREPWHMGDKVTLYLSDYTYNDALFDFTREGVRDLLANGGGGYGYTASAEDAEDSPKQRWLGPYGKRVLQITAFDDHAQYVADEVEAGDWVWLGNVYILYGHNGQNLEGKLRGGGPSDMGVVRERVNIRVLDDQNPEAVDPRVKEGIRRMRDWDKEQKAEAKKLKSAKSAGAQRRAEIESKGKGKKMKSHEEPPVRGAKKQRVLDSRVESESEGEEQMEFKGKGKKRKFHAEAPACNAKRQQVQDSRVESASASEVDVDDNEEESAKEELNAKQRRKLERQKKRDREQKEREKQEEALAKAKLGLNSLVTCENPGHLPTPVADMLKCLPQQVTPKGTNMPIKLTLPFNCEKYLAHVRVVDFHPSRLEDFAAPYRVSKYGVLSDNSEADLDTSGDEDEYEDGREAVWKWRFKLELEDAFPSPDQAAPERIWVHVDNLSGQLLTNLDACDLSNDETTLANLRERMFVLWGDLEENKQRELASRDEVMQKLKKKHLALANGKKKFVADEPPPSSDVENEAARGAKVSNKPFACCIQQYGVREPEGDPAKANAGKGRKWKRQYMMFGTKIIMR